MESNEKSEEAKEIFSEKDKIDLHIIVKRKTFISLALTKTIYQTTYGEIIDTLVEKNCLKILRSKDLA